MKIKKLLIPIFLSIFILSTPVLSIFAQEETEKTATNSNSVRELIKNADLKKVKGAINNLLNKKIAMIGQVTRITDETITIENTAGTKILALDNNPKIIKSGNEITIEKVEVENWAMILGKLKDDNFSPHFIYVFSKTLRPKNQVVMIGTITSISSTEMAIIPRSGEEEKTFKFSTSTNYEDSNGEGIRLSSFSKDINVLVTGFKDDGKATISTLRSLAPLSDE